MGYKRLSVFLLLALAACASTQDTTKQALDTMGDETSASWNKMRDLVDLGRGDKVKKEGRAEPRYCYRTLGDVLCYPTPIPGQEYRLTGYQETNGRTGYVLAPVRQHAPDEDAMTPPPAARPVVASTPPPTTTTPSSGAPKTPDKSPAAPGVAGAGTEPKKQLKEVIFDPAELEPKQLVPDKEQ